MVFSGERNELDSAEADKLTLIGFRDQEGLPYVFAGSNSDGERAAMYIALRNSCPMEQLHDSMIIPGTKTTKYSWMKRALGIHFSISLFGLFTGLMTGPSGTDYPFSEKR